MTKKLALLLALFPAVCSAAPAVPPTPAPVSVLYARPFRLAEGFRYDWRAEKPVVDSGYLVVLAVNPDLVYPRQTAEPVLFVGDQPAMRLNVGYPSGRVIALVPGPLDDDALTAWFGSPDLPERVDASAVARERERAASAGVGRIDPAEARRALGRGGKPLSLAGAASLLAEAGALVREYAPDEVEAAESLERQAR